MTKAGEVHTATPTGSAKRAARPALIITGAAGTIGSAICQRFAEARHPLHALDIDEAGLEKLSQRLQEADGSAEPQQFDYKSYPVDLRHSGPTGDEANTEDLESCFARVLAGLPDNAPFVLVHTVGAGHRLRLGDTSPADWRQDLEFNLELAYRCVHAVLPRMKAAGLGGSIVFIGSVNAHQSLGHPAYSAAKAGLISLSKAIALEYGRYAVRANIVSPATVRSQLWDEREQKNPRVFEKLTQHYPLGRIVAPREVAEAVYFLASDAASGISGVDLPVDCGLGAGNLQMARDLTQEDI